MRPLLLHFAAAATLLAESPAVVRATAEATVSIRPDQTRLRVGVVSSAGSAERASAKNAERTTDVITRVRDILGPTAEIHTANYSLARDTANGYTVTNTVEVQVPEPSATGKLIDAMVKSGGTIIGGIESSALDEQAARSEALKQATTRARANADAMAAALGLRIVRVVAAETSTAPVPVAAPTGGTRDIRMRKVATATPVEPAPIQFRAQVVVTVEVAQ